jgi:ribosomal protein S18 acetylase RimI-like enzyme
MTNIIEIKNKKDLLKFIKFPLQLYKDDAFYSPQLIKDLKFHFGHKNPFFKHAEVKFYIAIKDEKIAGRITSIIDRRHIMLHNEKAGFFGFFECIDDEDVANELFHRVYSDLKNSGVDIMRGPMNFSTNEECGFLIEGFNSAPILMTPYNPEYYNRFMNAFGMSKVKDLYAFICDVPDELPEKILRVAFLSEKRGISARTINKNAFFEDMNVFKEVYNSAWKDNWGFIPISDEELIYSAKRLKPIVETDMTIIAEKDGEPVGFLGLIPDYNMVLRNMKGRLNPLTILKALYYSTKITQARLLLLGIKEEFRNRGVDAILLREGFKGVKKHKYKKVEFSWILEDNIQTIRLVEMAGGQLYKRYRIYEKKIERQSRRSNTEQQTSRAAVFNKE